MPAWYDIRSDNIAEEQDADGIHESQLAVEALIAQEIATGIAPSHIFLAGFSQGGAIALHCGLHSEHRLGGILALSTYLPLADTAKAETPPSASGTPIFMAHGRNDPIVPYDLGKSSLEKLSALGYSVEWHEYAMQHTVCMEEVEAITQWLNARM
jgi:phospholipase/carboxylesterase